MPSAFPGDVTVWVSNGTTWVRASKDVDLLHYTNATMFVNSGRLIDGRASGLTNDDFKALKARYPDAVMRVAPDQFTLPLVPVGTIVDITPLDGKNDEAAAEPGQPK